eukprot:jgi/Undpi1/12656/HiC_scaffold_6.g02324.m1
MVLLGVNREGGLPFPSPPSSGVRRQQGTTTASTKLIPLPLSNILLCVGFVLTTALTCSAGAPPANAKNAAAHRHHQHQGRRWGRLGRPPFLAWSTAVGAVAKKREGGCAGGGGSGGGGGSSRSLLRGSWGCRARPHPRSAGDELRARCTASSFALGGTSRAAATRGRCRRQSRSVSGLLLATAIPAVEGSGSAEDPAEERPEPVAVVTVVNTGSGGGSSQAHVALQPTCPANDTLVPSGDPQLVSDILEIVSNSIAMPADSQDVEQQQDHVRRGEKECGGDYGAVAAAAASAQSEVVSPGPKLAVTLAEKMRTAETKALSIHPPPSAARSDTGFGRAASGLDLAAVMAFAWPAVNQEPTYGDKNSRAMVTELVAFTLPLLVVWLSNPIMSLVDTAVVGAQSSIELAALGPGTSLCDNLAYMCGFLAQVTTNLGASALASGDTLKADRATRTGMFVAVGAGLGVSYTLLRHGQTLLQLFLSGNGSVASSVLPHSCAYVYIRALGFVAVTLSIVLQASYLARKDVATPIKSVAGASVVNLVLDCIAVFVFGMGIKGAALSTTIAQWAGLTYLVHQFWPDLQLSGRESFFPYRHELKKFLSLGVPTCLALSGQVATCIAVTVAASGCDTVALAAHQVIYGVFLLFCPIGEAISQTVQTYLPGFTVKRPLMADGRPRRTLTFGKSAVRMLKVISSVALGLGAVNAVLASLLTTGLPSIFTPDRAVWAAMRSVSLLCGLSLGLQGVSMGLQVTRCALFAGTVGWSHRESLAANFFSTEKRTSRENEVNAERVERESGSPRTRSLEYLPLSSSSPLGPMALAVGRGGDDAADDPAGRLSLRPSLVRRDGDPSNPLGGRCILLGWAMLDWVGWSGVDRGAVGSRVPLVLAW